MNFNRTIEEKDAKKRISEQKSAKEAQITPVPEGRIIKMPFIKLQVDGNDDFSKFKEIYDTFEAEYNGSKAFLREKLREEHWTFFKAIIKLVKQQIDKNNAALPNSPNIAIDMSKPYVLRTNRIELTCFYTKRKDPRTMHNYRQRLMDAGIITNKQWHGAREDFELHINPNFLLIHDYSDENYIPSSPYLREKTETENRGSQEGMWKSFPPIPCNTRSFNNSIIGKGDFLTKIKSSDSLNGKKEIPSLNENELQEHPKTEKSPSGLQGKKEKSCAKKEKSCAKKEKSPRELYLIGLATVFYQYMIEKFMYKNVINPAQKEKAIQYLVDVYFSGTEGMTENQIWKNYWLYNYKLRLDMVADYVKRHDVNTEFWFPTKYLDVNNPKGFASTKKWLENARKEAAKRAIEKVTRDPKDRKLTDEEKFRNVLKLFSKKRNLIYLNKCESYVKKVIPQYLKPFTSAVREMAKHN